jgi:hypothetical protein
MPPPLIVLPLQTGDWRVKYRRGEAHVDFRNKELALRFATPGKGIILLTKSWYMTRSRNPMLGRDEHLHPRKKTGRFRPRSKGGIRLSRYPMVLSDTLTLVTMPTITRA